MEDSDNIVTLYDIPLERILQIVRELNNTSIEFDWAYTPPQHTYMPTYSYAPRKVTFVFGDPKYTAWFQLKYG